MKSSAGKSLLKVFSSFTGNRASQSLLEKCVAAGQFLQGVGCGADLASSGERAVLSRLSARSNKNARSLCIFDVGANIGHFLSMAADALRERPFHLHSFEPSPEAYKQLQETAQKYEHVTLNNFALGHKSEHRDLFFDVAGSQLASFSKRRLAHFGVEIGSAQKIRVEALDNYCADRRIEHIDLLKLDVEGHELDVLIGGSRMFRESRIGMVTFEFGGCNIDSRTFLQDFFYFFSDHGMRLARITPSGFFYEVDSYREILEQFRTTNFVCYRSSVLRAAASISAAPKNGQPSI